MAASRRFDLRPTRMPAKANGQAPVTNVVAPTGGSVATNLLWPITSGQPLHAASLNPATNLNVESFGQCAAIPLTTLVIGGIAHAGNSFGRLKTTTSITIIASDTGPTN